MELSLTKLPWYAQIGAFVILAGVGVGGFYKYIEEPARQEMEIRQNQLKALNADIEKGRETEKQLPEFRAQVEDLESRLGNLRAVLPEEKDAGDLLRRLQTVATQSQLKIKSFKPAATVTKTLHAEWPIQLELDGTYHNLAIFFDRVGKFTRIVNISGVVEGCPCEDGSTCTDQVWILASRPNQTVGLLLSKVGGTGWSARFKSGGSSTKKFRAGTCSAPWRGSCSINCRVAVSRATSHRTENPRPGRWIQVLCRPPCCDRVASANPSRSRRHD